MMKSMVLGLALSAFAWMGAAEASIVTVTYSGLMTEGTDGANLFGTTTDLGNQAVVVSYVFDTSKGSLSYAAGEQSISGGSLFSTTSPALSTTVTINNKSVTFVGDQNAIFAASDIYNASHLGQTVASSNGDSAYSYVDAPVGSFPNSIVAPLSLDSAKDSFTAFTSFTLSNTTEGTFFADTVSVSAVPLPATLPLFAAALVGLGVAAAWRKRNGAASAN